MSGRKTTNCALLLLAAFSSTSLAQSPWAFIVTGDSRGSDAEVDGGVNTVILAEIAAEIVNQDVDFVLFPGDLVLGAADQTELEDQLTLWLSTMQPVYNAGIDVYPVRGNHETGNLAAWQSVFSGSYALPANGPPGEVNLTYSVTHKNVFILGFDLYVGTWNQVNQAWMDTQLAANTEPHIFVYAHAPAFAVGHQDCLDDHPVNRDVFWASIENAGGRTYFCGHDHYYNHAAVDDDSDPSNDIHQYVVGTAGAPLRTWAGSYIGDNSGYAVTNVSHVNEYGYVLVEVDGLDVTLTWMKRVGAGTYATGDTWSYYAGPSIVLSDSVVDRRVFLGENLPDDHFTVANGRSGTLQYTITDDVEWLHADPTTGDSTGEADTIDIIYDDVASLAMGQHIAQITVSATDADNSPQTVTVNLRVGSVTPDFDEDFDVDQEDFGHFQACLTGSGVPITDPNCQDADLDADVGNDVDVADFAIFLNCHSGPNIPVISTCAD